MLTLVKPVFLVGAMRSGTTLLADLLGESCQIVHCSFELKDLWSVVGGVPMASPKTRDEVCHELGAKDVQPRQREKLTAAFIERMSVNRSGKSNDAVFLNKNPHLCNKLPFVDALFPDARFIWIYRHLPSVVSSLYSLFENVNRLTQTWHYWPEPQSGTTNRCWQAFYFDLPEGIDRSRCFPGGEVRYLAEYWMESNRAVADSFKSLPPDRRLIIQEEELIENTEEQLARCLAFLGLSPFVRPDLCDSIDATRNSTWGKQLTGQSLQQLLKFVEENMQIIGNIFPGKNYAEAYLREIKCIADNRRAERTNDNLKGMTVHPARMSLVNEWIRSFAKILPSGKKRTLTPEKQLIIGCVTENSPKYLSQTLRLLQSVRWFGGNIANASFRVCAIEDIDAAYQSHFERYGATVRIVPRFDTKSPVTNKIRFLQQEDLLEYDTVVLLDCDTIIVQDPSSYLKENVFRAKIADLPTMPHHIFEVLFDFFGVPLPKQDYFCTVFGEPTIPYFNTGVLIFPKSALSTLVPKWIELTKKLVENMELIAGREHFCEQSSMSLALAASGEKFMPLWNEMNFPTHLDDMEESPLLHNTDPFIIHYHSCFDSDGNINGSRYPLVNARIEMFNDMLRKESDSSIKSWFFRK